MLFYEKELDLYQKILQCKKFESWVDITNSSLSMCKKKGLFLEFGVFQGNTATHIINYLLRNKISDILYGFDSFEGLPEDWVTRNNKVIKKGHFKTDVPKLCDNIKIIPGLFEDTLPNFVKENFHFVSFMHIDCDLYSSTKTIFSNFANLIDDGTIILFDEIIGYEYFRNHEYKAFVEFLRDTGRQALPIGYCGIKASFKIINLASKYSTPVRLSS